MKELPKAYNPQDHEDQMYSHWESSGFFNPDICIEKGKTSADASPFTIVLPPPNVTGTLHMGHAVMLALEDIMIRYHRMKGDKTLWVPGTDHAAVATESKVEKMLIDDEGIDKPKKTLGRDAFLERVRQFAQESHDTIVNQSRKMGSSLDWSREAYTLDETRNKAVNAIFKKMFDDGLIYRGHRVINWSVKGQSTCSDDELVYIERPAKLYFFKYSTDFPITIATTRPETKLGDTAVAVHPDDARYKQYIGQTFTVDIGAAKPLEIKIIADENIDPAFGTGALGVTPAHSMVDFEMYEKQKANNDPIGLIQVIGEDGKMTAQAGEDYVGLSVEQAREKFVTYLRENNLLEKTEDIVQNAGTSDRFKDVVEPLPKTQWFINVQKKFVLAQSNLPGITAGQSVTLKEVMQQVVSRGDTKEEGKIDIIPAQFKKTYFHWIDNLRDWCISRQIWYGHQIPVWYKGDEMYCGIAAPEGEGWIQDPDTLDTWFSSGIWTFSTLLDTTLTDADISFDEWLQKSKDYQAYHPTSVLETGYDILPFWVARMILMTTYALGEIPFETVYLHGLVRDEQGRKMSKSLGNIINPLDMIEKYGTDATRLSLVLGSSPGNDMKLSEDKIAGFRNFTNKLWNIARFMLLQIDESQKEAMPELDNLSHEDRWILLRLSDVTRDVSDKLASYQFSQAGEVLRSFTWDDLADWYIELVKGDASKQVILNYILNTVLKLWHPYMPFVTETIWQEVYGKDDDMLLVTAWPEPYLGNVDQGILNDFNHAAYVIGQMQQIVKEIRTIKNQYKITRKATHAVIVLQEGNDSVIDFIQHIAKLAGVDRIEFIQNFEADDSYVSQPIGGVALVHVRVGDQIDIAQEKERLEKEIAHVEPFITQLEKKLSHAGFVENAPAAVIDQEKQKLSDAKQKLENLHSELAKLK